MARDRDKNRAPQSATNDDPAETQNADADAGTAAAGGEGDPAEPQTPLQARAATRAEMAADAATLNVPASPQAQAAQAQAQAVQLPQSVSLDVRPPKARGDRPWWIGLTPDCPLDQIGIGGVTFCKRTQGLAPVDGFDGRWEPNVQRIGGVVRLTDEQVGKIKSRIVLAGIRREKIQHMDAKGEKTEYVTARLFSPAELGDEPAAWYAFMMGPMAEGFTPDLGHQMPPPMAKRAATDVAPAVRGAREAAEVNS